MNNIGTEPFAKVITTSRCSCLVKKGFNIETGNPEVTFLYQIAGFDVDAAIHVGDETMMHKVFDRADEDSVHKMLDQIISTVGDDFFDEQD